MSSPRWYRSLYWRVALGLIAIVALMLAAQGAAFLWMTGQVAEAMPTQSPRRLAALVASDVGSALANDESLDLERYIEDQYARLLQTFVLVMRDGRVLSNHDDVPAALVEAVRAEQEFMRGLPPWRPRRRGNADPRPGTDAQAPNLSPEGTNRPGRAFEENPTRGALAAAQRLRRRGEFVQVLVNGTPAGRVVVLPGGPPFSRLVRRFGPTLALVGVAVLGVGATLVALVLFAPVRRRLRDVQTATEDLGGGDLSARAPEAGGDEVAALARSFNRMAEDLSSRARALETSDNARRQLLADVSHELMTPLTAMRGYVETLSMPDVRIDEATRGRYLGIVNEETHRLERIIQDLLDLARLEGGGTTMRRERVDVAALFGRVSDRHARELAARRVRLTRHVSADAAWVTGDPDRLEQALQNLAANALRYTPDGGEITLESAAGAGGLRLTVRDTGPGIPPERLALIFDRFYKVDASRQATAGSGLGLSIVRAIIERHGGTVAARNDGGAVFDIVLPAAGSR